MKGTKKMKKPTTAKNAHRRFLIGLCSTHSTYKVDGYSPKTTSIYKTGCGISMLKSWKEFYVTNTTHRKMFEAVLNKIVDAIKAGKADDKKYMTALRSKLYNEWHEVEEKVGYTAEAGSICHVSHIDINDPRNMVEYPGNNIELTKFMWDNYNS